MGKVMLAVFAALTFGAVHLTTKPVGVMEPSITKASVRSGSVRGPTFIGVGGGRGGGSRIK